jgi:hypothetical protein
MDTGLAEGEVGQNMFKAVSLTHDFKFLVGLESPGRMEGTISTYLAISQVPRECPPLGVDGWM